MDVRCQGWLHLVVLLITLSDERVQQVDELLKASGSGIELAARLFGWARRDPRPRSVRDHDGTFIGCGMATAAHGTGGREGPSVRVVLGVDGTATVQSAAHNIGTGTYTVMTQMTSRPLGMPMRSVTFSLGGSRFPVAMASVTSGTVPSVGSGVVRAATQARDRAIAIAVAEPRSPLHGMWPDPRRR